MSRIITHRTSSKRPRSNPVPPGTIFEFTSLVNPINFVRADPAHVLKPGGLVVFGPGEPTVRGTSLVFDKSNWKPTKADDILVLYKYPSKVLQEELKEVAEKKRVAVSAFQPLDQIVELIISRMRWPYEFFLMSGNAGSRTIEMECNLCSPISK